MLATVESHALQLCAENQWNEAATWYIIIAKILQQNGKKNVIRKNIKNKFTIVKNSHRALDSLGIV